MNLPSLLCQTEMLIKEDDGWLPHFEKATGGFKVTLVGWCDDNWTITANTVMQMLWP